ncbi:MAG: AAA family ATPase [Hyphomicrobiaceae bacterium]
MHIKRLRLTGFKSFVEPTELLIEPGLTGVVGPNGCGKSNLLEALRWVMGETSHKSMRASAMDDVIFAGTQGRPARNHAEVAILIDNSDRRAPAEFNGSDLIEVTRRIEREAGSSYRVNGAEARARDVKLLFEDAATGARSPALVRQGQISEIVNARPEQRRRILEDAAGTAGLYSRRHEAELRLKAAETNLARVADVLGQIASQMNGLKRQARQAKRFREISEDIRKLEAVGLHLAWIAALAQVESEEAGLMEVLALVGLATEAEAKAIRAEAEAAEALPRLREGEARAAAILQRLKVEEDGLGREETRARERSSELDQRIGQLRADEVRAGEQVEEAAEEIERLETERERMLAEAGEGDDGRPAAERALAEARAEAGIAEAALTALTAELATERAERQRLDAMIRDEAGRIARAEAERAETDRRIAAEAERTDRPDIEAMQHRAEEIGLTVEVLERRAEEAEAASRAEAARLETLRQELTAARLSAERLATEGATLRRIFARPGGSAFPPVLDRIKVVPGFEAALGAAIGEDLDLPSEAEAPTRWSLVAAGADDPALPEGAIALSTRVKGPPELARRLAQIGIVADADGPRLQSQLAPGQRLVSRAGALWRWDGVIRAADAPSAAAQRLAQINRLEEIEAEEEIAGEAMAEAEEKVAMAIAGRERAEAAERSFRADLKREQASHAAALDQLNRSDRIVREAEQRARTLLETRERIEAMIAEHRGARDRLAEELAGLPEAADRDGALAELRLEAERHRGLVADAQARLQTIERELRARTARIEALGQEIGRWRNRASMAEAQRVAVGQRIAETRRERDGLEGVPAALAERRTRLAEEIAKAESERGAVADRLAEADSRQRDAARILRETQAELAAAREARARTEVRLETARERRAAEARRIGETLGCEPDGCLSLAGLAADEALPDPDEIDRRLVRLKDDRERLGGVNLRAEEELTEIEERHQSLDKERGDLEEAIARLRQGIAKLNREGRKRLDEAFRSVDQHFQNLFRTLFGGGEARLELIEAADDPLAGGLEIIARPPGKKPATLSLLSGGEQTLTALSLIFAVFLTNPSPICVLDEVDAPLDDSNVDRFCTLMEEMARQTETRFLVITHHPMTMARMQRLFGVTMAEKGVSQLVSVDLAVAETYREAG